MFPFFTFRVVDIVETTEKDCQIGTKKTDKAVRAKVTVVTVMEIPYQSNSKIQVFDKVPVHHRDIILADSGDKKSKCWKEIDASKEYGSQA